MKTITNKMIAFWRSHMTLDLRRASKATQKGHVHIHHEAAWASIGDVTPAEFRRRSKKRRQAIKAELKAQRRKNAINRKKR